MIVAFAVVAGTANAANITWVNASSSTPDANYKPFLEDAGHTVTGMAVSNTPDAGQIATLNAADLIIVDGSRTSGSAGSASTWNSLTAPLIMMGAYAADNWNWSTGNGSPSGFVAVDTSDPVWDGITLPHGDGVVTEGIRYMDDPLSGGTIVASHSSDTEPGDGHGHGIVRWDAGSFVAGGGERMFFAAGTDAGTTASLTSLGEDIFLNAVDSTAIPEPASLALLGLGSLLIAGRRRRN